jgi:hypothetical protein
MSAIEKKVRTATNPKLRVPTEVCILEKLPFRMANAVNTAKPPVISQ